MRRLAGPVLLAAVLALPAAAAAAELPLPDAARMTAEVSETLGSYALPVGPWRDGTVATLPVEGQISHQAFRIDGATEGTLALMAPLRDTLLAEGFTILYDCAAADCGGFDFRYDAQFLPEPEMHVDLGDYRYLAAVRRGPAGPEHVMLMVSRSDRTGFVQVTRIGPAGSQPLSLVVSTKSPGGEDDIVAGAVAEAVATTPRVAPGLIETLVGGGSVALDDLVFASGSAELGAGPFASLDDLAAWMKADPGHAVTLVGHTDATGSLEANIAVSKARAGAVMARLVSDYGVPAAQLSAEGVGFLAPRAGNEDDASRRLNRRVEAVLR